MIIFLGGTHIQGYLCARERYLVLTKCSDFISLGSRDGEANGD